MGPVGMGAGRVGARAVGFCLSKEASVVPFETILVSNATLWSDLPERLISDCT